MISRDWRSGNPRDVVDVSDPPRGNAEKVPLRGHRTEGERVMAERMNELVRRLAGWIEERRLELFGRADPPFRSLAAAQTWIEREGRREGTPKFPKHLSENTIKSMSDLYDADPWRQYRITISQQWLSYWTRSGHPRSMLVSRKHRTLYRLYWAAERISETTTLPPASVVAWILTGTVPGIRVQVGRKERVVRGLQIVTSHFRRLDSAEPKGPPVDSRGIQRVVLDLDIRDLTDRNLRVARREAMKYLTGEKSAVTAKQRRVIDIVQRLGGPPKPRFNLSFWTRVAKESRQDRDPIAVARLFFRGQLALAQESRGRK